MPESITPVHPFSLGPGGSRFEILIVVFYMSAMLKGELPLGFENRGAIYSIKLQQRNHDNPVDDIVIKTKNGTLSIQVKHKIRFTNNKPKPNVKIPEFYDALHQCWDLFNDNKIFNKENDRFGIAFDVSSFAKNTRTDINDAISWAQKEISVESYLHQLKKFKEKFKYFTIFQELLSDISKKNVNDQITWDFLRHFALLPFDFGQPSSHSYNELLNKLNSVTVVSSEEKAIILQSRLYDIATEYAISGGEFDTYSLEKQLPHDIYSSNLRQQTTYVLQKNLAIQLEQQISREKKSKKYIPGVFVEVPQSKEELRYFSDPVLFIQKIIEDLQKIDTYHYNESAKKIGFPQIEISIPEEFQFPETLQDTVCASELLKKYVSGLISYLTTIDPEKKDLIQPHLNSANTPLFNEIQHLLWGGHHRILWDIQTIEHNIALLTAQVIIIKGKAASGKTNFVCNFADTTIRSREQTTFYITGYDISSEAKTTSLKKFLINQFNEEYDEKISRLLADLEKICSKEKKPLLIIIDGINEHSDLVQFAKQLEQVITDFTSKYYIKFILTCRSEYFDKRFSNLTSEFFFDKVILIDNLTEKNAPIHKDFMIDAYFQHYKIECQTNENVKEIFVSNPLILRLFCESYGTEDNDKWVPLAPLNDINLEKLFIKYNDRISDTFDKQYPNSEFKRKYRKLLSKIAEYMLNKRIYSNVSLDLISDEFYEIISILVTEGVILRKDLTDKKSVISDNEVLNFTFDEYRDFILADYLLNKIAIEDFKKFKRLFSKSLLPECPVAEGLGKYSFLKMRRDNNQKCLDYLKTLDKYDEIFLKNIFSIEESSIDHTDIKEIERLFFKDSHCAEIIYYAVLNRRNKIDFPNLNIWIFLDLTAKLTERDYQRLIKPIFSSHFDMMEYTCKDIKKIIDRYAIDTIDLRLDISLIELLICISPVPTIQSRFYPKMEPFELFFAIAEKHPKLATSTLIKYLENSDSYVAQNVWRKITLSNSEIFLVEGIYDVAKKIRNLSSINSIPSFCMSLDNFISIYQSQKSVRRTGNG
ncbi:NACHT domain-containing NTPase [Methanoregula sp.]|uniref:NACHT domain-containing protein n=1 Tax=Methanoregula sp. TaxID=2052170 RepID=UPI00356A6E46